MPRTRLESRATRTPRRHGTVASPIKVPNRAAMLKSLAQSARQDAFGGAVDAKIALHTRKADARGAKGAAALEAFLKNKPVLPQPGAQATVGTGPAPVQPGAQATVGTGPAPVQPGAQATVGTGPAPIAPVPTPASGLTAPVQLLGNDHVRTFDGHHDISATGNRNKLTISGHCPELRLTGNDNTVVITGKVDRVVVSGNNNRVTWPAGQPAPEIVQAGLGNSVGEG
ncbi:MAG: DUF3060 domain-containing protein [Myxococcaceae bacterium]|nr:DUF3060 domain-containing protein [Myxococcaceae bacterium]